MTVHQLDPTREAELRAAKYTYAPVGQTAHEPSAGMGRLERRAVLVRRDFAAAADDLLSWRLHERSGLRVWASETPLREDTVVLMKLGVGPLSLRIPCRVAYVVSEPRRRGFAYGTLPGHPETGEELFLLEHRDDGSIELSITAFSRPASPLARLGGPVSRWVQRAMTDRYLRALDSA